MAMPDEPAPPGPPVPAGEFALRVLWIALRLLLVMCIGQKGSVFFYQNF